jgi:hypothetical protein
VHTASLLPVLLTAGAVIAIVAPEADIRWSVPSTGNGDLSVYDVTGRVIAVLVKGPISQGMHLLHWDLRDGSRRVPSGVYFIRADADGQREQTLKVVVER